MIRLDKRLDTAAKMVRDGAFLVDVGTDHGYLIGNLAAKGKIRGGIACDINEKPLDKARQYLSMLGVSDKVSCVLSDGFQQLTTPYDEAVIAGMGGELIARIILTSSATKDKSKRFIVQPMSKAEFLREELWANGFSLLEERAVETAGKCYTVMNWQYTGEEKAPTLKEKYLGIVTNFWNEDTASYLKRINSYLSKKLNGLDGEEKKGISELILMIDEYIEKGCV